MHAGPSHHRPPPLGSAPSRAAAAERRATPSRAIAGPPPRRARPPALGRAPSRAAAAERRATTEAPPLQPGRGSPCTAAAAGQRVSCAAARPPPAAAPSLPAAPIREAFRCLQYRRDKVSVGMRKK
ncbi:unnamed protein product [Urochloa humidicola]